MPVPAWACPEDVDGDGQSPDFLFQIIGNAGTDPVPAAGRGGLLLIVTLLGGGAGYVLARRRRGQSSTQ